MWRRPKWQTLLILVALVVLTGHFIGKLQEPALPPVTCPEHRPNHIEIREITSNITRATQVQTVRTESLRFRPNVNTLTANGIPTGGNPHIFQLISEMNSTIHHSPWQESEVVAQLCKKKNWREFGPLPDVTVIISFHNNENIFNILHTLHAVVKRSPPELLREIILIDDNTRKDEFLQLLEMHLHTYFRGLVRLVRSDVDLGLIRARLNGIRAAKGKVVVVMDSHVEPQPLWLEPILYEIVKNRRTLATSYLDWMQKTDRVWNYRHGASSWKTYFDWTFTFGFQAISNEELQARSKDPTEPVRSAVTVGTVWGMDKAWFEEVGAFDERMERWGGENLDLAVRVWLFGGRVVNIPCSHVAHLEKDGARDYRNSWTSIIQHNYKRFAEVWLDDYTKYFYLHLPHVKTFDVGDLSDRLKIKARAKYDFAWFLKNVFPELGVPDVNAFAWGGLQSSNGFCFDTMYQVNPALTECSSYQIATQGMFWTTEGLIRFPIHVVMGQKYFDTSGVVKVYEYTGYHNTGRITKWFHIRNGPIIDTESGLCVQAELEQRTITLATCQNTTTQFWRFRFYSKDYDQLESTRSSNIPVFKTYLKLFENANLRPTAMFTKSFMRDQGY